jgi:hypothetical protein
MVITCSDHCFHYLQFAHINALTDNVISTYSGQIERIQNNPSWMRKSYHLFVGMPMHLVVVAYLNFSLCILQLTSHLFAIFCLG